MKGEFSYGAFIIEADGIEGKDFSLMYKGREVTGITKMEVTFIIGGMLDGLVK